MFREVSGSDRLSAGPVFAGLAPDLPHRPEHEEMAMLRLEVTAGCDQGRVYELTGVGPETLGRQARRLRLTDRRVSRHHARFYRSESQWLIRDLGSQNGTRLNGAAVDRDTPLNDGDRLTAGGVEMRVQQVAEAEPPGTTSWLAQRSVGRTKLAAVHPGSHRRERRARPATLPAPAAAPIPAAGPGVAVATDQRLRHTSLFSPARSPVPRPPAAPMNLPPALPSPAASSAPTGGRMVASPAATHPAPRPEAADPPQLRLNTSGPEILTANLGLIFPHLAGVVEEMGETRTSKAAGRGARLLGGMSLVTFLVGAAGAGLTWWLGGF